MLGGFFPDRRLVTSGPLLGPRQRRLKRLRDCVRILDLGVVTELFEPVGWRLRPQLEQSVQHRDRRDRIAQPPGEGQRTTPVAYGAMPALGESHALVEVADFLFQAEDGIRDSGVTGVQASD